MYPHRVESSKNGIDSTFRKSIPRDSVGKIQQVSIKKGTVIGDSTRVVTSCLAKSRLDLLEVQRRET